MNRRSLLASLLSGVCTGIAAATLRMPGSLRYGDMVRGDWRMDASAAFTVWAKGYMEFERERERALLKMIEGISKLREPSGRFILVPMAHGRNWRPA